MSYIEIMYVKCCLPVGLFMFYLVVWVLFKQFIFYSRNVIQYVVWGK